MKKNIVAPLVLLSSLTLLTSCMEKKDTTPAVPAPTQTAAPVDVVTTPIPPAAPAPSDVSSGSAASPTAAPSVLTRTETVSYKNPSGSDEVEFSVTVTDGVITAVSANPKAKNEVSIKLQTAFAGDVASKVIGKNAKDLDVDAIGGASLTTGAFETFARSF